MCTPATDPPEGVPADPPEGPIGDPPEMQFPGAGVPGPSGNPDAELPQRLAERIDDKAGGIASGEPDLLPDVEVPDSSM
jgi:hypothetical protein